MAAYVERGGLKVAAELDPSSSPRGAAGTGVDAAAFWAGSRPSSPTSPREPRAAAPRATRCRRRSTPGTARALGKPIDVADYEAFLREIGYLVPEPADFAVAHRQRRPRDRPHRRPAAGGAGHQRPLRAERRQRALGQPVRRALRHRRHPRGRRRRAAPGLQPGARRQGHRLRPQAARPGRAAAGAGHAMPRRRAIP